MNILEFIFQSFWHFVGVTCLIIVILEGLADIVGNLRKR